MSREYQHYQTRVWTCKHWSSSAPQDATPWCLFESSQLGPVCRVEESELALAWGLRALEWIPDSRAHVPRLEDLFLLLLGRSAAATVTLQLTTGPGDKQVAPP